MIHSDKPYSSHYQCVGCVSGHVLRHKHTKHPAVCTCEYCGETFTQAGNMRTHMRTIHKKTQSYTFHCGEVFITKLSLHSHYMRVHMPEITIEAVGKAVPVPSDVASGTTQTQDDGMNLDLPQSSKPLLLTIRIDDAVKTDIQIVVAQLHERSSAMCL